MTGIHGRQPLFTASRFPLLLAAALLLAACPPARAAELKPFSSDGCSLFPDGTPAERGKWCDCCFEHDIAYWRGGTAAERAKADDALRDCVLARTGDKKLAETMRLGVRAGGHPVSVMPYRWGYGWEIGRGYKPLDEGEKARAAASLDAYRKSRPDGYCADRRKETFSARRTKPLTPSEALRDVVGEGKMSRDEIVKKLYAYIKKNGLQDKNSRLINCDRRLEKLFPGKKQFSMFDMAKMIEENTSE